jgi:serine/threonine protein kinase
MLLSTGERVGSYEIIAPLGAGGMGEVYKATDTRLDRTVAIKVSKTEFSQRFEREARAIAAPNHPNICTPYDVGPNYLVICPANSINLFGFFRPLPHTTESPSATFSQEILPKLVCPLPAPICAFDNEAAIKARAA